MTSNALVAIPIVFILLILAGIVIQKIIAANKTPPPKHNDGLSKKERRAIRNLTRGY